MSDPKFTPAKSRSALSPGDEGSGRMNWPYLLGWYASRCLCRFYFRCQVCNADRVPTQGAFILAANHTSYLDPLVVGGALRRPIHYLARETLFRYPGIGWLLHRWKAMPVDRDGAGASKGLRMVLDQLHQGEGVLLFPEGTRSRDGRLQPARSGIGLTVVKSQAPVVPARIFGAFEAMGREQIFPKPKRLLVKFGHPLHFETLREEAKSCSKSRLKEIYRQIADEIMETIGRLEPHRDKHTFP